MAAGSPIQIDRAGVEEWPRVRRLRLLALASDPGAFGSTHAGESAFADERWRSRVADAGTVFFLAADGYADVGLAWLTIEDGVAGLYSMWVAPSHRRRGIGRALVERVTAEARLRGHAQLVLEVVEGNRDAVELYERCGFVRTGRTTSLPPPRSHVGEFEMVLELRR